MQTTPTSGPRPWLRSLLGLALGALLFGLLMLELPAATGAGGPDLWVADRDADELVGLDKDLFVVRRVPVRAPVALAAAPAGPGAAGGRLYVASSLEGWALGQHGLFVLEPGQGPRLVQAGLGPVLDLEVLPGGEALVVELGLAGPARVSVARGGSGPKPLVTLLELDGATCAAARSARQPGQPVTDVLVGDDAGGLTLVRDGQVVATRALGGELGDLAPGPAGTWFVLEVASPGRLHLLDADLALLWSIDTGLKAQGLAVVPGEERVWLVDSTQPLARRFGPGGGLELEALLLASDAAGALARPGGGVVIATPGALLRLDGQGGSLPGQGGFDHLVDLAPQP